jgi:hypothetical protein
MEKEIDFAVFVSNFISFHFSESSFFLLQSRVAKWYIFKPKIPIWVNFGGPCNGTYMHIL